MTKDVRRYRSPITAGKRLLKGTTRDKPISIGTAIRQQKAMTSLSSDLLGTIFFLTPESTAGLKLHPICDIMPAMQDAEFVALDRDIELHGVIVALHVMLDGRVIDGRHRLRVAQEHRLGLPIQLFLGTEAQAADYVLPSNVTRRHLTKDQRSAIVVEHDDPSRHFAHGGDRKSGASIGLLTDEERAKRAATTVENLSRTRDIKRRCPQLFPGLVDGSLTFAMARKQCPKPTAKTAKASCRCATCKSDACPSAKLRFDIAEATREIAELKRRLE